MSYHGFESVVLGFGAFGGVTALIARRPATAPIDAAGKRVILSSNRWLGFHYELEELIVGPDRIFCALTGEAIGQQLTNLHQALGITVYGLETDPKTWNETLDYLVRAELTSRVTVVLPIHPECLLGGHPELVTSREDENHIWVEWVDSLFLLPLSDDQRQAAYRLKETKLHEVFNP